MSEMSAPAEKSCPLPLAAIVCIGCCIFGVIGVVGCAKTSGPRGVNPPKAVDAYVRAVSAYNRGDESQAIKDLERATKANPDLRMAHSMLGDLYQKKGNLSGALQQFKETVRLDPYAYENHYRLGVVYQLLHRLQDAVGAYLRALQLNPKDPATNFNLGSVYLALNQYDDAVKYLRKATELNARLGEAWANLGVALDLQGNGPAAELAYKRAVELNAAQSSIVLNLGLNLLSQGKASEAAAVLAEAAKKMNTPFAWQRYGDALSQARRYDEAMAQYEKALNIDANYYPAYNAKAAALIQKYQQGLELEDDVRKQAVENWKQSLAINAQQPRIQQQMQRWGDSGMFRNVNADGNR
jgi:superkiller protein 3